MCHWDMSRCSPILVSISPSLLCWTNWPKLSQSVPGVSHASLSRHFIGPLLHHHRVIGPNYMGFCKSETPQDRTYLLQEQIENLEALLLPWPRRLIFASIA